MSKCEFRPTKSLQKGGKYISSPDSKGREEYGNVGEADYPFEISSSGQYVVVGRIVALDKEANSFFIRMDDGEEYIWDIVSSPEWEFAPAIGRGHTDPLIFDLNAGKHILRIRNREDGTKLDYIKLVRIDNLE